MIQAQPALYGSIETFDSALQKVFSGQYESFLAMIRNAHSLNLTEILKDISPPELSHLGKLLNQTKINELNVSNNDLTNEHFDSLCEGLKNNFKLKKLDFSYNKVKFRHSFRYLLMSDHDPAWKMLVYLIVLYILALIPFFIALPKLDSYTQRKNKKNGIPILLGMFYNFLILFSLSRLVANFKHNYVLDKISTFAKSLQKTNIHTLIMKGRQFEEKNLFISEAYVNTSLLTELILDDHIKTENTDKVVKANRLRTIILPYHLVMLSLLPQNTKKEFWDLSRKFKILNDTLFTGSIFMESEMPMEIKNKILQYISPFAELEDDTLLKIQNKYLTLAYKYQLQDEIYKMGKLGQAFKKSCTIK